jgi:sugar/nucleoside kinase (ribokinase family)
MPPPLDVVTVGHAIVDVLAHTEDRFVADLGLAKGTMTLVDDARAAQIHDALGPSRAVSGGSAANTAAGIASFGSRAGFIGRVRDDDLGRLFADDIRSVGVHFDVPAGREGPATGRSVVMVTPDAEKTMCTSLGIGDILRPEDVDAGLVQSASVVYIEGYLCGLERTDPTVEATLEAAERGGTTVSLSLSDPFWVELHGAEMAALLPRVHILFANEHEACGLTGAAGVEAAIEDLAGRCETVVVTCGAAGCVVAAKGQLLRLPAAAVTDLVDTTGAGDLFAAGFLHGWVRGEGPERSARLGALASAEVITHLGARPVASLRDLAAGAGLG